MISRWQRRTTSGFVTLMVGFALAALPQGMSAQQAGSHNFEALPDGGRIEVRVAADDAEAVKQVREQLKSLVVQVGTGEISTGAHGQHMQSIPGAAVMLAKRAVITYAYREIARGAEVRITTRDAEALRAVHEFIAYHKEHHAAGAEHHGANRDHNAAQHGAMHQSGAHHSGMHQGAQHGGVHQFDALADGGRIEAQRADDDAAGIAHIRAHLQAVTAAFRTGDFAAEDVAPLREMPGVAAMIAKRSVITLMYRELPRGGEVRIATRDAEALKAIHEFIAFHKQHHGGAHDGGR